MSSKTLELLQILEIEDNDIEAEYNCPQWDIMINQKYRVQNTPGDTLYIFKVGSENTKLESDSPKDIYEFMLRDVTLSRPEFKRFIAKVNNIAIHMSHLLKDWNEINLSSSALTKINMDYPKHWGSFCEIAMDMREWGKKLQK